MCQSGGFAGKLYRVEVDEIEYIAHIDIVQVDGQRVVGIWGSFTVDDDVLLVVLDRQVVDREVVLVIIDACRFDMPYAVANGDGRGLDVDVGCGHAVMVVVEVGLGIDDSGEVALVGWFGSLLVQGTSLWLVGSLVLWLFLCVSSFEKC